MTLPAQFGPGYVVAGRYRLDERLGRGGMSTVWRATDQVLNRQVAVKVVAEMEDAEVTAERFRREARATAALNHPNIVTIFDAGVDHGRAFLVMELLPGKTLADELRLRGAFPIEEVREIAAQVAVALGAAHAAGLVHRDIKPGNIARTADGAVKVLDFGITHIIDEGVSGGHAPLTATGAVIGTAAYLAPEQARGQRVDGRADLYALGCVVYALLTGGPPFKEPTAVSTMMAHATDPVPDLLAARPDAPPEFAALVHSLLAKSPDDRPQNAAAVAALIRAEEPTRYLPPIPGDETTAVRTDALIPPAPLRAHPAEAPGPAGAALTAPTPARAAEPFPPPEDDEPGEGDTLFPMLEDEDDNRRAPLVALVALALLLVAGLAWWLLTRDADLTADPAPTAAVPGSASPSVIESPPAPETTAPATFSTLDPMFQSPGSSPLPDPTLIEQPVQEPEPEVVAPTTAAPPPATSAPPVTTQAPATRPAPAPPPATTQAPPPPPPPAVDAGQLSQRVQAAADDLSRAVQDATTGGGFDRNDRKTIDAALRELAKALRESNQQLATDAVATVDQALSASGERAQFDGLYAELKARVEAWKAAL